MESAEIERLVMKPTARRRLGKYVLLGRLGAGGMGKIYLAYAPGPAGIEKILVVKRLHAHLTNDPVLINNFLDEARLSMALSHPNIVHTFDVGDVDGRYFMVMEYIEGQNLGVVLRTAKRSGRYPSSSTWGGIFLAVLDGLHAAHVARDARGRPLNIIHRDVSPQNILLTYDGLPKLVDFGIAKAAMRVTETDAGVLKGKYAYMSPEQVRGEQLDARSDVFAAGIVLWEMLAGRRLYKSDSVMRSVERILTEPTVSPVRINPACDPELARIVIKALKKDRNERFDSAMEMRDALDDALRKTGAHVRQSEVRELMHSLFGDVITQQRGALEARLANEEKATATEGEAPEAQQDMDSEMSRAVPGSPKGVKPTDRPTPSASAATGDAANVSDGVDGDGAVDVDPKRRTSVARKRPRTNPFARRTTPTAPFNDMPAPARGTTPATSVTPHVAPTVERAANRARDGASDDGAGSAAAHDATPHTAPATPPRRRTVLWVSSLAAGTVAFYAAVQTRGLLERDDVHGPGVKAPIALVPIQDPVMPLSPVVAREPEQRPEIPHQTNIAPKTPTGSVDPVDGSAPPHGGDVPAGLPHNSSPHVTPLKPTTDAVLDTKSRRASDAKTKPSPSDSATLTLDTVPWTVVYLGTKRLGETPLVRVKVPAGTIELTLENPELQLRQTHIVTSKPGQEYRARLDLQ